METKIVIDVNGKPTVILSNYYGSLVSLIETCQLNQLSIVYIECQNVTVIFLPGVCNIHKTSSSFLIFYKTTLVAKINENDKITIYTF